jgi:hypothetical protein
LITLALALAAVGVVAIGLGAAVVAHLLNRRP